MRRSYEFKQESYVTQENVPWNYHYPPSSKSHTIPTTFNNYYDPTDEYHGYVRVNREENYDNVEHYVKKYEHHSMGAKSVLRPPLGSVPPRAMFDEERTMANHSGWRYGGRGVHEGFSGSLKNNNKNGEVMHEEVESLVKRIEGLGRKVEKIEVIEYEVTRHRPGLYREWKVVGSNQWRS